MIIGIGNDLVDVRRIERSLARFGMRFEQRIFTPTEIAIAEQRGRSGLKGKAATLAKRFAAKEACAKALSTGIGQGIQWHEIAVENLPGGAPQLVLTGKAREILQAMIPQGMQPRLHLSLADEYPMAQAFVVISAVSL
ncbi:MAG TPA: holo-ACP synthase [Rickettsiales bacterium]|nr:holo-ACP synthase [Rickettsiales bacterium]